MNKLSREQARAFEQYQTLLGYNFASLQENCQFLKRSFDLLQAGFVAGSDVSFAITKIPKENHWCWNQSNAKITMRVNNETLVTFRKLSPRRRYFVDATIPHYKIWIFHTQSNIENERYYLWCETGVNSGKELESQRIPKRNGTETEIGLIYPELLTVESLSFLKPFIERDIAKELGW